MVDESLQYLGRLTSRRTSVSGENMLDLVIDGNEDESCVHDDHEPIYVHLVSLHCR